MAQSGIFDEARRVISRGLIEQLVPGGDWRPDGDYWVRSPLRSDGNVGSFHITAEGLWHEFTDGSGGDLIDLVCAMRRCDKRAAAEEIVRLGGGTMPDTKRPRPSRSREKVAPVLPVPAEALATLRQYVRSEWAIDKYGECTLGSRYEDAEGRVLFCVARYERAGKKTIRPYYYGEDGKWHEGQALDHDRPILNLPAILAAPAAPVLLVEGEKCAAVEVPGYVVTTWAGGSAAVEHTDWSPLATRDVVIWPDADGPGLKAAAAIKRRLPKARVLQVEGKPQGWDAADAAAEGLDLAAFIRDCPTMEMPGEEGAKLPFSFLGFDTGRYWFLPRKRRVPYTIDMGRFTSSQLLELAPLAWWGASGMVKDNGSIRADSAQDWIIDEQEKVGMVDLRRLRGAGVWRDGEQIVVNDGAQIVTMAGERLDYDAFASSAGAEYIPSETRFGEMTGEESDDAEGAELAALYGSQKFARRLDPVAALGWALIAPFGGLLKWRPHLWITGRRGTGKSTVLIEKLIDPLLGEFAHEATGRATEAGLRRAANLTARPIRLDEFDPGPRQAKGDIDRLGKIVVLARNASCDSTAVSTLASGETGTVTFIIRSCFLFASVNLLQMDAAIESRVVRVEKEPVADIGAEMERMKRECSRVMADPARYRRRIFRALPRILSDIDAIHEYLLAFSHDAREADVIAPLLCAAWAVQSTESVMGEAGRAWLAGLMDDYVRTHGERVEDEERVVEHILEAPVRTDDMKTRTIAELLHAADGVEGGAGEARAMLARYGLSITDIRNGDGQRHRFLAVAQHSGALSRILQGTPYEYGYEQQIRRHPLCKEGEPNVVRIAGKSTRCRCLEWEAFRERYLGAEPQGRLEGVG